MYNIETLYSSYQELLLDLDIFGRLAGSQDLDDREAFKDLLFQEYAKARPIPTLESKDCELSEPVSEDFHVSYRNELELAQGEEVLSWDDEDEEDEQEEGIYEDVEVPDDFPRELFRKPVSIEERDTILAQNEYFKASEELDAFTGDESVVVESFGTIEQSDELTYVEEDELYGEDSSDEGEYDYEDEDFDYEDDIYDEDETFEEDVGVQSEAVSDDMSYEDDSDDIYYEEQEDIEFVDEVYDNPKPVVEKPRDIPVSPPPIVLPNTVVQKPVEEVKEEIPADILQYLRLHPRCEISEVLKHYPRKDLERYIRIGKVIKKGSKVYI